MTMDLIILESPNKVKEVERYAKACGFDARALATVGHLIDLPPMSEGTSIDTRTFTFSAQRPRDDAAGARAHRVKAAIAVANRVIVATDPDREGESIAAEVWGWIAPGKAWRARFEEITLNGVRRGLEDMQPALRTTTVEAARARRVVDRLAGWHGTAVVFDKLRQHRGLSAGRLQSAALRLVVERHAEREQFRPRTSFVVHVALRTAPGTEIPATLVNCEGAPISFGTETEARAVTMPTCVTVTSVETYRIEEGPRPPFEASSWLQVASKTSGSPWKKPPRPLKPSSRPARPPTRGRTRSEYRMRRSPGRAERSRAASAGSMFRTRRGTTRPAGQLPFKELMRPFDRQSPTALGATSRAEELAAGARRTL